MSRYAFVDINYSDDVLYGCTVSKYSSISVEVYTHIVIAPTISPPELASSIEDNAFSFTCNVQSFLSSTVKWYKYDLEGEIQEVSFITDDGSGSAIAISFNNIMLNFENVTFEDAGVYQCSVTDNELGEIRSANATFTGSFRLSNVQC